MSDPTHGPIVEDQREMMNALAGALDAMFNPPGLPGLPEPPKKVAFVLLTAKFADYEDGRVNYISNGERSDMIKMMEELLGRLKA